MKRRRRLGEEPEFPEGWEQGAGNMGHVSMLDWPEPTATQEKAFKKQLEEKQKKKLPFGFQPPNGQA